MASVSTEIASKELERVFDKERSESYRLPILNGKNYLIWAESWEIYFEEMGLWSVVDIPTGQALTPADAKKSKQVYLMILTHVSPDIQPFVKYGSDRNACKAWKLLKEKYQGSTAVQAHVLETRLEGLKYDHIKGITALFAEGLTIMTELHAMGEMVKESRVVLSILKALPDSFKMEKAIIKSNPDITMQKAESQLLLAENEMKMMKDGGETALVAQQRKKYFKPKCWHCKKIGHKKPRCPDLDKEFDENGNEIGVSGKGNVAQALSAGVFPQARSVMEVAF